MITARLKVIISKMKTIINIKTLYGSIFGSICMVLMIPIDLLKLVRKNRILFLSFFLYNSITAQAQTLVSLDSLLAVVLRDHPTILESNAEISRAIQLKKTSFNLPNPEIGVEIPARDFDYSISQSIEFPLVYLSQLKLNKQNVFLTEKQLLITKSELIETVRSAFLELQYIISKRKELKIEDSLLQNILTANIAKYNAGAIGLLEKLNAQDSYNKKQNELLQSESDLENAQNQLNINTGIKIINPLPIDTLTKSNFLLSIITDSTFIKNNPTFLFAEQNSSLMFHSWKLEKTKMFPGLFATYFNNTGQQKDITNSRFDLGVSIPLWFWTYTARIKAAKYKWQASQYAEMNTNLTIRTLYQNAITNYSKAIISLQYFESNALPHANIIIEVATKSYKAGEIGYIELIQNLNNAFEIRLSYSEAIKNYNNSVIQIQKITGQ